MNDPIRLETLLKGSLGAAPFLPVPAEAAGLHPLGVEAVDQALGGGLAGGRLHEVFARDRQNESAAIGFVAMLAFVLSHRGSAQEGLPLLWLREEAVQRRGGLYAPGLADLGLDPDQFILGVLPDVKELLRAGLDGLRCSALSVVVLELHDNPRLLDLTASRRLVLAAERSGVTPLLLRLGTAKAHSSAAHTRWQVGSAASIPLEADAPGQPMLHLSLLRQRGGAAGLDWTVEWNRDATSFRAAALSRPCFPLSGRGSVPLVNEHEGGDAGAAGWRLAV